ncbi:TetR/AcrR family transcriptional regulator [Niallia sp. 01092]|uniref:TetR/AcrR family transcriptional regulator n=1 Tax=unclassified Niallia TaxID=2837522 RepID=UPI003FD42501
MSCTNEIDSRAIMNLKQTMMDLLMKKDIRYIKTKEITEQAHVSRSIMFQYYKDKYALFNDIIEGMKKELKQTIAKSLQEKKSKTVNQQNKREKSVLHFIMKHRFFFQTLMNRNKAPFVNFHQFFLQSCVEEQGDSLAQKHDLSAHYHALYYYSVCLYWLNEERILSPEYICEKIHKLQYQNQLDWIIGNPVCTKKTSNHPCNPFEEAVHHAFIELMIEKENYSAITISDIAKKSNIRRASIYNYYASKEDLFKAIIKKECSELIECCAVPANQESITTQQIEQKLDQLFTYLSDHTSIFSFIHKDCGMPNPLAEMFYQFTDYYAYTVEEKEDKILFGYYVSGIVISIILYHLQDAIEQPPTYTAEQLIHLFED